MITPSTQATVLLFGPAARATGQPSVTVALHPGSTVADLLSALAAQHPQLTPEISVGRLAIDHAFATPDTPITDGQELALISMVSGG